jgi:hypothetical protein
LDGDFSTYQEKVLALPVVFDDLSVRCTTLRGEVLSFGWQEPFMRDEQEQPVSGVEHFEHPYVRADYPCKQMEIRHGEDILRLNFDAQ